MNENDDATIQDPGIVPEPPVPTEPPGPEECGPAAQEAPKRGRRVAGALLVVLVLLLLVVGLPNLLNAIQRGKQKRTMGDMRTIATAMESYSIDNMQYVLVNGGDIEAINELVFYLEPTYVKQLPRRDAWHHSFRFEADASAQEYTITSFGRDGLPDGPDSPPTAANGGTTDFRNDIVFSTGSFFKFPDGRQQ